MTGRGEFAIEVELLRLQYHADKVKEAMLSVTIYLSLMVTRLTKKVCQQESA